MPEKLTIWTFDWVPDGPRGFVRDLRLRWAAEEAGLNYDVRTVPFNDRETNHFDHQPFGQVPFLTDGSIEIFESGAGLLHLARRSETLMPRDPIGEAKTLQWVIAALNSIEMVTVPWWFLTVTGQPENALENWMNQRLADLLMADVLRVAKLRAHGHRPATETHLERVTGRPAILKAHADQLKHFAAADVNRCTPRT